MFADNTLHTHGTDDGELFFLVEVTSLFIAPHGDLHSMNNFWNNLAIIELQNEKNYTMGNHHGN